MPPASAVIPMAAFVLPVVPPRTGGGGGVGTAAASSSPPRRRRHHARPLPVVAVVVPVVRAAAFERDPPVGWSEEVSVRGTTGGGNGGGACRRGLGAAGVKGGALGRELVAVETETVGTSRLSATTSESPLQPQSRSETGAGDGAAAQTTAFTTNDTRQVASGDGDAVTNASSAVADDDAPAKVAKKKGKNGGALWWLGRKHTDTTRAKISAANRGRVPWNKGRQHSEETRARIAAATRAAMSRPDVRNRVSSTKSGHKHSPETRSKIRASCTAYYLSSCKTADAQAATGSDGVKDGGSLGDSSAAVLANGNVRVRTVSTRKQRVGNSPPLPFRYDNAVLGPQVLAALPPLHKPENDNDAAADGKWVTGDGNGVGADDIRSAIAGTGPKRGPLSPETRAKLSRRIRDLWADPSYRARVTAGIASRSSGRVRQRSTKHQAANQQSPHPRNADLQGQEVARSSTRNSGGQARSQRQRRSGSAAAGRASPRTSEEQTARAEAKRLKRQERQERRAARRAARDEEDAARRQSQKALVSQLVSAGSLPPLESLVQLDSWSGVPVEAEGDPHEGRSTSGNDSDSPDFDAIRAAGVSLQGRLRGVSDGGGRYRGDHVRGHDGLIDSTGATAADGSGVPGVNVAGVHGGDAGLPPGVLSERIDYGDQLSFDLVSSPTMSRAADVLEASADNGADDLLREAAAGSTDIEDEDLDSDLDEESDDDDWDFDDDSDDDDSDGEYDEGFDFTWEYEVDPREPKSAAPVNDAPVRKRTLTYVNGAATMVDNSS
ncbi:hypothetical protein MMPV_004409 [Pyropia vietnamensis]